MSAHRAGLAAAALWLGGCGPGLRGQALVRLADGGIGSPIPGVRLTFVSEDGAQVRTASTDASGRYSVALARARYFVRAEHAAFEDDSSAPGFSVVSGSRPRPC